MSVLACLRFAVIPYTAKMPNNGGCKFVKNKKKKRNYKLKYKISSYAILLSRCGYIWKNYYQFITNQIYQHFSGL